MDLLNFSNRKLYNSCRSLSQELAHQDFHPEISTVLLRHWQIEATKISAVIHKLQWNNDYDR